MNFDERPHCRGFFMGENLVWHWTASAADKGIGAVAYVRAVGPMRCFLLAGTSEGSVVFTRWHQCAQLNGICFHEPAWVSPLNNISIRSAVLTQLTAEYPYIYSTIGCHFFLKIAHLHWDLDLHLIRGSLVPPNSTPWAASRSVVSLLQGLRSWSTDRQTDSVCSNRPHLASAAMRRNVVIQELIRRWDSERELLRSAPGSYPNSLK